MKKKNLVFISAVWPTMYGNGLNIRALRWFYRFEPSYNIYLILCPIAEEQIPTDVSFEKYSRVIVYQANRSKINALQLRLGFKPESWLVVTSELKSAISGLPTKIDNMFCLRMYNLPLLNYLCRKYHSAKTVLDLDELESRTRFKTFKIAFNNNAYRLAIRNLIDSSLYRIKEYFHLPRVPYIYVSTQSEMQYLKELFSMKSCEVFLNKLPTGKILPMSDSEEKNILFVGNLGHYPNVDAVELIINEILLLLKKTTKVPFKFYIVGKRAPSWLSEKLTAIDDIIFLENITDMQEVYAKVHLSIVPLQSGGGSSFKVLESLKYGRPLIATTIGIRGFNLKHQEQVLIGDTVVDIVENIVKLFEDEQLVYQLRSQGYRWVKENYMYDA